MRLSPFRRMMLWGFAPPASPHVTYNGIVDFGAARDWLDTVNATGEPNITIQHLVAAAVGRALAEYPEANAGVVGRRVVHHDHVGVVMPVDLTAGGDERGELGFVVLDGVERSSVREIAHQTGEQVRSERRGKTTNAFVASLLDVARSAPRRALHASLDAVLGALNYPWLYDRVMDRLPVTTMVSNVGSALRQEVRPGVLFRGASVSLPPKLALVGTIWGVSVVQEEVIPWEGKPTVRPVLPLVLLWDHRLLDGVAASRLFMRVAEFLLDPEAEFGSRGERRG